MDAFPEPNPEQNELSSQANEPTTHEIRSWDKNKLLLWIQKKLSVPLKPIDVEKFLNARIDGTVFFGGADDKKFFQDAGLSFGASFKLAELAGETRDSKQAGDTEGNLSNQTAGRRRKGDEIDAPEPPISAKRNRQEDILPELVTRANERRKRIRDMITDINRSSDQHSNSIEPANPLPGAVNQLSNPTFNRELPFPSVIDVVPNRFKDDGTAEAKWLYMGRTKFKELVEKLKEVRKAHCYTTLWLYGTQGYGKSHLLAALVCYLAAQDERVVYIPDCREWLRDPVGNIRVAMLFAWADDITTQKEIMTLNTDVRIEAFLNRQRNVIVVVNQLNALKESNGSSEEIKRHWQLYTWLMRFTSNHTLVFSSSANYMEYLASSKEQTSNCVVKVYGGLDRTEMDQWWIRHGDIDKGGYKRRDVEDVTGCIPLLLDKCVVGKKIDLDVAYLRDIYYKAVGFVQEIRTRTKEYDWQWYTDAVKACISHQQVPSGWTELTDLIDHRYFYRRYDDDTGGNTCGLIRDAVAEQLLMLGVDFADTGFLTSLRMFTTNPSVTGFMIESAVLSSIRSHGLAIGAKIKRPMKMRLFSDFNIATDIIGEPVLYCPKKFNHAAIDGIIVLIEPNKPIEEKHPKKYKWNTKKNTKKNAEDNKEEDEEEEQEEDEKDKDHKKEKKRQKLRIFPLQITLALSDHKDSHAQFFDHCYDKWAKGLSDFEVVPQFLWITPDRRSAKTHKACDKWPQHRERFIHFEDVNVTIWRKYRESYRRYWMRHDPP